MSNNELEQMRLKISKKKNSALRRMSLFKRSPKNSMKSNKQKRAILKLEECKAPVELKLNTIHPKS